MSDRRLEEMRSNPRGDYRVGDFTRIADRYGVDYRFAGGSHVVFRYPGIDIHVSVPARRPIKPVYVKQFLGFMDEVIASGR